MIPAMIAYTYEANIDKKRAATVISFQALGWLAGIAAAGFANDLKLIFLIKRSIIHHRIIVYYQTTKP